MLILGWVWAVNVKEFMYNFFWKSADMNVSKNEKIYFNLSLYKVNNTLIKTLLS